MTLRFRHLAFVLLAAASLALPAARLAAQNPDAEAPSSEPVAAPSPEPAAQDGALLIPTRQLMATFSAAPAGDNPLFEFLLTPQVFGGAEENLRDLRVLSATNREVPYALRFRERVYSVQEVRMQPFNESTLPDGSLEVSFDFGIAPEPHNEVQVLMQGNEFRRQVTLEGGNDGEKWNLLKEEQLRRFDHYARNTIDYPTSRFRYLRLRIAKDPVVDKEPVAAPQILVRRRIDTPGEEATRPVTLQGPYPTREHGVIGTAWTIDLGGKNTPCQKLTFEIPDADFARDYTLTPVYDREFAGVYGEEQQRRRAAYDDGGSDIGLLRSWQPFAYGRGTWQRRPGAAHKPLEIDLGQVRAGRMRLFVADHSNSALTIQSVQATAPVCALIMPRDQAGAGPFSFYFGDPSSPSPRYDFARNLPQRPEPAPARVDLGWVHQNPAYVPPPLPFTEQWRWLIHTVLAVACAVVAGLVYLLAQRMIAEHDAREGEAAPAAA